MRKPLLPLALFAVAAGCTAAAQTPATAPAPRAKVVPGEPAPPGAVAVGPDGKPVPAEAKGSEGPKESPRLAKLKQLQFDRRPSAILKAWAPESKDAADKRPTIQDPKEAELEKELAAFRKNVTLGNWAAVKDYLASLPDEEAIAGYRQLLQGLQRGPAAGARGPMGEGVPDKVEGIPPELLARLVPGAQQYAERNTFGVDDLLGLAAAAPAEPNAALFGPRAAAVGAAAVASQAPAGLGKDHLPALSGLLSQAIAGGVLPEVVVARLKVEVAKDRPAVTRRQVARLLTGAGQPAYAGDFLPSFDEARAAGDLEGLNLLSRHYLALHAREKEAGNLEKAWGAVQAVLASPVGTREEKEEGLLRAVELAPRVKEQLGQGWLDESFTKNPERGMEILSTVGTLVSQGITSRPFGVEERQNALKLMKTAVEALLKAAPDRAKEWRPTLTLLAVGWLKEAEFSQRFDTSAGSGPRLRRDMYGNIFFAGDDDDPMNRMMMMQRPDMPRPVPIAEVVKAGPTPEWVAAIDESLRPKVAGVTARLHLKANDEDKAFPLIEHLAPAQPDEAKELVKEFLRVWTRNHDPNAARNQYRYSWYFFAFEMRAESIPLTRSKQERNLKELSEWVTRMKKLPRGAGDIDDEILVKAFTACHSSAEVYRTEAIEAVFGPLGGLKPKTLAALADQMRTNLAGLWKDPAEQQKQKTNRKKKDIEAEVLRGYAVAHKVIADGLKKFPDHWALLTAGAGLIHDEVNYRQELNKSSDFSARRAEAFALYRQAAEQYRKAAVTLPEPEHTVSVYEQWFAAALGAVDLGMITEEKQPDWKQPPLIKAAILALPGDLAEKHLARFANNLFIRMSGAKPHVKFNYLKAGFEIVGEHDRAVEAKKVFDYYKDLVTEIKLDAVVDGSTRVGHGRPFGLFVNIRHTRDIERESGGFGRYLQNQNSGYYSYNYGRPTADYRDRFETAARAALKEHFEVVSVTFQDEKVHSRAADEFGWRYTPYAYILLKPRGPQVDKLPPLRIDFDFLDTSGYVVLPVESPAVPIDCRDPSGDPRPVERLTVTQTLDERQAEKGTLLLEVKAVGVGLVPDLNELCTVAPEGFEVVKTEDQGLAVKKFEEDADRNSIVSERVWLLTLKGKEGLAELPRTFRFAPVRVPKEQVKEVVYQRFNDADLAVVGEEVSLEATYGKQRPPWVWLVAGVGFMTVVLLLAGLAVWLALRRKPAAAESAVPADLNAFTVSALLREIRSRPGLSPDQRAALDRDLAAVERHFFSPEANGDPPPDLRRLVERWAVAV
jgi:hypothetical protein